MKILIIVGHPRAGSFSESLARCYAEGASQENEVCLFMLAEKQFDLNVRHHSPKQQAFEPDLAEGQELISWADHITFIYPTWWGSMPALLKGFIDRVFTEGFAFNEIEGGTGYAPLLRGKTASVITTMDTPFLVYQLIYRSPGHNMMRRAILEFCGLEVLSIRAFGPVRGSTAEKREQWLLKSRQLGENIAREISSPYRLISNKAVAWLKAIRLQFYPMTAVAYGAGAWAAEPANGEFDAAIFWTGYLWIFFLELATVLINEYADQPTDGRNRHFGPFTGGSRVIVDKDLTPKEVRGGIRFSLFAAFTVLAILFISLGGNKAQSLITCGILTILALGYTAAPLKLSYRTLGEVTVGLTHSVLVVLCGYLFMGGDIADKEPWLISLPLFFSILPSITLAGIPDRAADEQAGKMTLAVRFGKKKAMKLASIFTAISAVSLLVLELLDVYEEAFKNLVWFAIPHAVFLIFLLRRYTLKTAVPQRIDWLMVASLTYLVWFCLIPLLNLS